MQADKRFKGIPRPYHEAKRLGVIDVHVRELVDAMYQTGFITKASCQGHGFLQMHSEPYIAFTTETNNASVLNMILESDSISKNRQLHYYWVVQGRFNEHGDLVFILTLGCERPRSLWWCVRRRLRQDFLTLTDMVKVLGQGRNHSIL